MKKILNTLLAVALSGYSAQAAQIIIEGNYQGKNLYISNPYAGSGVGFCVYEVYVNDKLTTDEWNSSAFEVDFSNFSLKSGDKVVVRIKHKDDCKPKVLNPEVLKPRSTFEIVAMKVEKDGSMNWKAKGETGKLAYVVEQFRWNKWIKVTEVQGKGIDNADYSAKVVPHSGENKFRVKQIDFSGSPRYSEPVKFRSMSKEITFSPQKADKEVIFSDDTMFEVWDQYGNIVKKGSGAKVDVAGLQKGIYYLNFDNKTDKFVKK